MRQNLRLPEANVSTDYQSLLNYVFDGGLNKDTVVCITTDTGGHADQIVQACEAGARFLIVDKPLVTSLAEYNRVAAAVRKHDVTLMLTYNHQFNAPVHQIRHLAKEVGVRSVKSWFLQSWLGQEHKGMRQFEWRTADKLCGPLDIWSHAENLASFVLGQQLTSVSNARLGTGGGHNRGEIYTSGNCSAKFADGTEGEIRFDQTLPGHLDDIGAHVVLKDGHHLMWRLELGVDNLWMSSDPKADAFNLSNWTRCMRGDPLFAPAINAAFDAAPAGHHDGWGTLWQYLFTAAAGTVHRALKTDLGPAPLPPILGLEVPGLAAAEQTARFVAAAVESFEKLNGGEVALSQIVP